MRSAPAASASSASRSPSSSALSVAVYAHHLRSIDGLRRAPGDEREGSSSLRRERGNGSRATATERAQELPLGGRLRACAGSSSGARSSSSASSPERHWTARAPWPGAGSIVSAESHSVTSLSRPIRRTPAAASTAASNSPSATLRTRVSTFPRIERTSRSPRSARSWAARRRLLVPTREPGRELRERAGLPCDEAVAHVLASGHRADHDVGGILGRQVLERVHGQVDLTVAKRALELRREEPLPADLGQRLAGLLRSIAGRRDHRRRTLEPGPRRGQQPHDRARSARERAPMRASPG